MTEKSDVRTWKVRKIYLSARDGEGMLEQQEAWQVYCKGRWERLTTMSVHEARRIAARLNAGVTKVGKSG